jgi:hypothetical protein
VPLGVTARRVALRLRRSALSRSRMRKVRALILWRCCARGCRPLRLDCLSSGSRAARVGGPACIERGLLPVRVMPSVRRCVATRRVAEVPGLRADFIASDRFHGPAMNVYRRFQRHAGRRRCQLRLRMRFLRGLLLEQRSREQRKPSTRTVRTLGATGGRAAAPPRPRPGGARRSSSSDAWGHRSHRGHGGLGPARPGASSRCPRYSSSVCARREHRRSHPFARSSII